MKTIRLIKAQSGQPVPQPSSEKRAARESALHWVREYQTRKPANPRAQFAELFKRAA